MKSTFKVGRAGNFTVREVLGGLRAGLSRLKQLWPVAGLAALTCMMVPSAGAVILTAADVQKVINQASSRAAVVSPNSVIAVVDREGNVLSVWAAGAVPSAALVGNAVSKAGTACFLDSNQNALTTRSATYVVQPNFPPGIMNRNNGPLIGVNNSHFPYSDVNRFRAPPFPAYVVNPPVAPALATLGGKIPFTSLSGFPGGVPLYKQGELVGGVGVAGDGVDVITPTSALAPDVDEDVALAGQIGFEPKISIRANRIFLDGISLPYVKSTTQLPPVIAPVGAAVAGFPLQGSPLPPGYPADSIYPVATIAGVKGELRNPIIGDPTLGGGNPYLTQQDVQNIIEAAVKRALITRSGVRLPLGSRTSMFIAVVNNPRSDSVTPQVLGLFKMPDAVTRAWEFTVQKARTCVYFSSEGSGGRAMSTRTVGFLSQFYFPPGINGNSPGLFFGFQDAISRPDLVNLPVGLNPYQNGITIFPGGQPLYKGTTLVGAIGISGDAIDQDDLVAASGAAARRADGNGTFVAPVSIRADQFAYRGVRLPFAKFPRQPVR